MRPSVFTVLLVDSSTPHSTTLSKLSIHSHHILRRCIILLVAPLRINATVLTQHWIPRHNTQREVVWWQWQFSLMVRGVTSYKSKPHAMLVSLLAELTAASFFDECFKGCDSNAVLTDQDKAEVTFAVSVVSMLADKADGWQFVPYINGNTIARLDGRHKTASTNPLYIPKRRGALIHNRETEAALARVPESFIVAGEYYSTAPEMQTKGVVMPKSTFEKLLWSNISMKEVLEEVSITDADMEPLQATDAYSDGCDCESRLEVMQEQNDKPSKRWDILASRFLRNSAYHIHQGSHAMQFNTWTTHPLGRIMNELLHICVEARFKPTIPNFCSYFDLNKGIPRVITFVTNSRTCWPSYPVSMCNELKEITPRWVAYSKRLREGGSDTTLWQRVRAVLAIANDAAVDYVMSKKGKSQDIIFSPWEPAAAAAAMKATK